MKIGELAKIVNLNVETLRYYERLGLVENPHRTSSGYRNYDKEETIGRISFIQNCQQLGFSLIEIKTLINLEKMEVTNENIDKTLVKKVNNLDARLNELILFKDSILKLVLTR